MTLQVTKIAGAKVKRQMGVQQALEWAFAVEHARLDLDVIDPENDRGAAVGNEWILMQRAILGCKPDCSGGGGWGGSAPHHDAEVIAAIVAGRFDRRTAGWLWELARARITPDWMPGATPRCVPTGWRKTKYGTFAETAVVGMGEAVYRGRVIKYEQLVCPVTYAPTWAQIHQARRSYLDWMGHLVELSAMLRACEMLAAIEVTSGLPPITPWRKPVKPVDG